MLVASVLVLLPYRRAVAGGLCFLVLSVAAELYPPLVWGRVTKDHGVVARPIGRHRSDRKKMSSLRAGTREARRCTRRRSR